MSSAVRSPSASEYSFLQKLISAWSISSPATRIDSLATIPPSEMTATSVVPPPMSTTMLPLGSYTGRPAPDHPLRLRPDRQGLVVPRVARDHRRLVEDDALAPHVDHGVGGAEVDRHVVPDDGGQPRPVHVACASWRDPVPGL